MSVNLAELALADVRFDEAVFGQAARISVGGSLNLARGVLESDIDVRRLDGPGGELTLQGRLLERHPAARRRPRPARAAGRPGRDAAPDRGRAGDRPDRRGLGAARRRRRHLRARRRRHPHRRRARRAALERRRASASTSTSAASSRRWCRRTSATSSPARARSGSAASARPAAACASRRWRSTARCCGLDGDLETGADGFLRDLTLTGIARRPGRRAGGPAGAGRPHPAAVRRRCTSTSATPAAGTASWCSTGSRPPTSRMEDVTLRLGGLAQNLEDPARRNVTINVEGLATGVWHADPEVAARARQPHRPLRRRRAAARRRRSRSASCSSAATACRSSAPARSRTCVYTGRNAVRVADLAVFAGLAQRPLGGAIDLRAIGSVSPLSRRLRPRLRRRRHRPRARRRRGSTRCSPARRRSPAARCATTTGFRTEDLRLANPQLSFASNGQISSTRDRHRLRRPPRRPRGARPAARRRADRHRARHRRRPADPGRARGAGRRRAASTAARSTNLALGFTGDVDGGDVTGSLDGSGGARRAGARPRRRHRGRPATGVDRRPRRRRRPEPADRRRWPGPATRRPPAG